MSNNQDIWYKAININDYPKISEIGQVVTTVRFLPDFSNLNSIPIYEKDVSRSKYPNAKKWFTLVMVLNDMLRPENNNRIGVMEVTKSLKKCIDDSPFGSMMKGWKKVLNEGF